VAASVAQVLTRYDIDDDVFSVGAWTIYAADMASDQPRVDTAPTGTRYTPGGAGNATPVVLDVSLETITRHDDRYVSPRRLGEGGMGVISLVRDSRVGRDIALKQLKPEAMADGKSRRRFVREACVQGQLEHPAIVPVYDLSASTDGSLFFTMKRVRGKSLADVLEALAHGDPSMTQQFSRRRLLTAFSQVCASAQYAHERGVVHRDIKPSNIMLGDYGEVYLLDWGIAKVHGDDLQPTVLTYSAEPADSQLETHDSDLLGTIGYMSPEQARGDHATVDSRSDVYALGAILFEILTYHPLHARATSRRASQTDDVDARPSVRFPNADVAPELEAVCVAATHPDAAQRLQSARDLHVAIEAYLDGDRDLALRRSSSAKHADSATAAADEVLAGKLPTDGATKRRAEALNEVGRALALDPGNQNALRALVRLLTNPPTSVPAEVEDAAGATLRRHMRVGGAVGIFVYAYVSLNALFTYSLGIHDWTAGFVAAHVLWAGALAASVLTFLRPRYLTLFGMFLFGAAASIWVTAIYSPQLMVPMFLTVHAAMFSLIGRPRLRLAVLIISCGGWTLSVFGEHFGLFPPTVQYFNGGIFLSSPVINFPGFVFTVYLYLAVLALIAVVALVVGKLRANYAAADLQLRLQAWQLHQLVKDSAAQAMPRR
jgi:serine/threonine-protein kinase